MKPGKTQNRSWEDRLMRARGWFVMVIAAQLLISSCAAPPPTQAVSQTVRLPTTVASTASATSLPTAAPAPTETGADRPAPLPSSTAEPASPEVCSPLEGFTLQDLRDPNLLKTAFEKPRPGMDDGHHGVDFAYWSLPGHPEMHGLPVYSVLPGTVVGVIENRSPYGNAVIIETPLRSLPERFVQAATLPDPQPTVTAAALVCPPDAQVYSSNGEQSVYLLYAHMDQTPGLKIGESVACGGRLGEVGTTGKSVNYHLHLEARAGPSGSTFPSSMAHYDTAATSEERSAYCTWRVTGLFQMFDPMTLFP